MRIVFGRGSNRQSWVITPKDYENDKKGAEALFLYCGLVK